MREGDVIRLSLSDLPLVGGDLVEEATRAGWLHPFSPGQWLYSGQWVTIFRSLQTLYVSRIRKRLEFEEWMFPRMIPRQALDSFELTHYRPGMLFGVGEYEERGIYNSVLDPVQCVAFYHYLRQRSLSEEMLPLKIVECLGGWTW